MYVHAYICITTQVVFSKHSLDRSAFWTLVVRSKPFYIYFVKLKHNICVVQ